MRPEPILAIDLGGSKIAAALVDGPTVLERRQIETPRHGGPEAWITAIGTLAARWTPGAAVGVAVTGVIRDGHWQALNPNILSVPDGFPLVERLSARLGIRVIACNDAQAAAWGEHRYGAGQNADLVFLTISTGIGGGIVLDGRLIEGPRGIAGHVGITPIPTREGSIMLEELASGSALARLDVERRGAPTIAAAAHAGEAWAETLMDRVVAPLALALRRLQLVLDPVVIVIGGGLGLAPGYLDRLRKHLEASPSLSRPVIRAAALGADAGLVGIADLVRRRTAQEGKP